MGESACCDVKPIRMARMLEMKRVEDVDFAITQNRMDGFQEDLGHLDSSKDLLLPLSSLFSILCHDIKYLLSFALSHSLDDAGGEWRR